MSGRPAVIGFALVLEYENLLFLSLLFDLGDDACTFDVRSTDFGRLAADQKDFVESDIRSDFRVEFFNEDLGIDFDFHLLSASFNNCVHVSAPPNIFYIV